MCSKAQPINALRCGIKLLPFSVREYSTLGGISGNNSLLTSLSSSNIFSVAVNTLGEISGMARLIALNRVLSFSDNIHNTSIDHLPENLEMTFRIGHASMHVYFFKLFSSSNLFIFNISYLAVTGYRLCKFLFIWSFCLNFVLSNGKRLSSAKLVNIVQNIKL